MDDSADTKDTMQKIRINYPVVLGDAKFGKLYGGVLGLPLQFLVGADGKILAIWSGEMPTTSLDKEITNALNKVWSDGERARSGKLKGLGMAALGAKRTLGRRGSNDEF